MKYLPLQVIGSLNRLWGKTKNQVQIQRTIQPERLRYHSTGQRPVSVHQGKDQAEGLKETKLGEKRDTDYNPIAIGSAPANGYRGIRCMEEGSVGCKFEI